MRFWIKGTRSDVTVLLVVLAASLALNVFLVRDWRRSRALAPKPSQPDFSVGERLPPLHVKTVDGRAETIPSEDLHASVVYVFSPSCPWCRRNHDNIRHLAAEKGASFRFIGLSVESKGLAAYLTGHQLGFLVYAEPSPETRAAYRIGGIPQTVVLSPTGTVLKSWRGAYQDRQQEEVEKYFGVKLPGLVAQTTEAARTP
jgi:peroxiredoxin